MNRLMLQVRSIAHRMPIVAAVSLAILLAAVPGMAQAKGTVIFRDGMELVACASLAARPIDSVQLALDRAFEDVADPFTESGFVEVIRLAAVRDIRCLVGDLSNVSRSKVEDFGPCQTAYCPEVDYCGPGDSQTNLATAALYASYGRASQQMNQVCFKHDRCYDDSCQTGPLCTWSRQLGVRNCDRRFFDSFLQLPLLETSLLDVLIAAAASSFRTFHLEAPIVCGTDAPCPGRCIDRTCRLPVKGSSCSIEGIGCPEGLACDFLSGSCYAPPETPSVVGWICQTGDGCPSMLPPVLMLGSASCGGGSDLVMYRDREAGCLARWGGGCAYGCASGFCTCVTTQFWSHFPIMPFVPGVTSEDSEP